MKVIKLKDKEIEQYAKDLGWQGTGTENEPFIIDSLSGLSDSFWIKKNTKFIHLKNCTFTYIWLVRAQNIIVENCTGDIYLHHCHDIRIENCNIPVFRLSYSLNNVIRNCSVDYVYNHFSRGNQFGDNNIPPQFTKGIIEGTSKELFKFIFNILPLALLIAIMVFFTSEFVLSNPLLIFTSILGVIILAIVEVYMFVPHYRTMKKLRAYPPNTLA